MLNFLQSSKSADGREKDEALGKAIKRRLGYFPKNLNLYKAALTHGSTLRNTTTLNDGERLEFLGDAVIELVVSEYLYQKFPDEREGFLTQMRSRLVSRQHLAELATEMNLQPLLTVYNVHVTKNILGNAFEAIIGAMYLDIGYQRASRYFTESVLESLIDMDAMRHNKVDFKSQLMELGQRGRWRIVFDSKDKSTIPQNPEFYSVLTINGKVCGTGIGHSKKDAEQRAAQKALEEIARNNNKTENK
jgi:ribonuclease-3